MPVKIKKLPQICLPFQFVRWFHKICTICFIRICTFDSIYYDPPPPHPNSCAKTEVASATTYFEPAPN